MNISSPYGKCIKTIVMIQLIISIQASLAGCIMRCLDSCHEGRQGASIVDEELACAEKQGLIQGFLLSPAVVASRDSSSPVRFSSRRRLFIPDPYHEPPPIPPKSFAAA